MPRKILTGSRIRDIRIEFHLKQADLAAKVGISAAYLNLIEHNKRRIGGKLLLDIARALGVDATSLSERAEEQTIIKLRDAALASGVKTSPKEMNKIDDLARRFPNWSAVIISQHEQINRLSRMTTEMTDRLAHDPFLSDSLHDAISTVTAIRSTASILAEPETVDVAFQKRFTENLIQDAKRLADALEGLVKYFDETVDAAKDTDVASEIEKNRIAPLLATYPDDHDEPSQTTFLETVGTAFCDPFQIAAQLKIPFSQVLRRIAALPVTDGIPKSGLVICNGAGGFGVQIPIEGFSYPTTGGACALWPLFQVLMRPHVPVRTVVEMPGFRDVRFLTYAIAEIAPQENANAPAVIEATMLILPETHTNLSDEAAMQIGVACRICPRDDCAARNVDSILS